MNFEENIKKNNIILPSAADPVGSYVATKIVGKLLYISGQISIDTEGTELDILKSINLNNFDIKLITVEHNFTEKREAIYSYLNNQGYKRVLESFSQMDDWYVKS